ncbi:MAG: GNAT family N-acetyltransferase [Patescibacteria group bacterium]
MAGDIVKIGNLIKKYSNKEALLPRSREELELMAPNFLTVYYCGQFAGCVGFKVYDDFQAEILSWVVDKQYRNHGIGSALITSVMETIEDKGIKSAIALTVYPGTFEKHGFKEVSKDSLTKKILADCIRCPRNKAVPGLVDCPEHAYLKGW